MASIRSLQPPASRSQHRIKWARMLTQTGARVLTVDSAMGKDRGRLRAYSIQVNWPHFDSPVAWQYLHRESDWGDKP